jgi:hypothetical protein
MASAKQRSADATAQGLSRSRLPGAGVPGVQPVARLGQIRQRSVERFGHPRVELAGTNSER